MRRAVTSGPAAAGAAVGLLLVAGCASGHGTVRSGATTTRPGATATTVESGTAGTGTVGSGTAVTAGTGTEPTTVLSTVPSSTAKPTTTAPAPPGSGVRGTVTAGPTCPVERVGDPCPPRPVQTGLKLVAGNGAVVATGQSGADGSFLIAASPGSYTLESTSTATFPRCPNVPVTVNPGAYTTADMNCDTGIR